MHDFVAFPGLHALLQGSQKLIRQGIASLRGYSIEIGGSGAGPEEVIQHILRCLTGKYNLILYEIV